jgi:hypothetical protein
MPPPFLLFASLTHQLAQFLGGRSLGSAEKDNIIQTKGCLLLNAKLSVKCRKGIVNTKEMLRYIRNMLLYLLHNYHKGGIKLEQFISIREVDTQDEKSNFKKNPCGFSNSGFYSYSAYLDFSPLCLNF